MSGLITVIRGGAKTAPKKAPTFFSRVDEAAKELPRTKGTGKEFMAELKKQPGVKKAELDDRKLSGLESAPKMTKEEFIQKLEQKPAPKIDESIKAHPTDVDLDEMAMKLIDDKADELTERKLGKRDRFNRYDWDDYKEGAIQYLKDYDYDKYLREAKRNIEENIGADFPKYEDYKLPGGENYREILLKLPGAKSEREIADANMKAFTDKVTKRLGFSGWDFDSMTPSELVEYEALNSAALKASTNPPAPYKSSHWDEPNVLAHIRVQDRVGPNGEKILHVEEIQSDWHQAGRKKGYKSDVNPEENKLLVKQWDALANERRNLERIVATGDDADPAVQSAVQRLVEVSNQLNVVNDKLTQVRTTFREGVPYAPFKKNWHELATKRIMDYAIQNGYDKVAITPGAEQASRYDLSKHLNEINYGKNPDNTYSLTAVDKRGRPVFNESKMTEQQLESTVGKDVAQKIINGEGIQFPAGSVSEGMRSLSGLDLKVGGEGMKGFYDQILPAYINKEYGKYGSQVNMNSQMVPVPDDEVPIHTFDITPQMREDIQSKGQPLYQATGIGLTGAAAAPSEEKVQISDNPDTMMLELQDQGFAGGGLLKKAAKAIKGTQEALPAAEREANLQRMLAESKAPMRLYHGTMATEGGKGQEAIRRIKPSKEGALGSGVYLTPQSEHASTYAGFPAKSQLERDIQTGSDFAKESASQLLDRMNRGAIESHEIGGNMLPVYAQIKNPLVLEGKGDPMIEALTKLGMDEDKAARMVERAYENKGYIGKEVETRARAAGYDGLMQYRDGDLSEVVSYNPNAVKSAIGNQGTYDITDPDLNKAVGGLARAKRK